MESPVGRALLRLAGVSLLAVAVVGLVAPRPVNVEHRWQVVVPVDPRVAAAGRGRPRARLGRTALGARRRGGRWRRRRDAGRAHDALPLRLGRARRHGHGTQRSQAGRPLRPWRSTTTSRSIPTTCHCSPSTAWASLSDKRSRSRPTQSSSRSTGSASAVTLYAVHLTSSGAWPVAGPPSSAQLATLVLVGTSPWLAVPYTDFYAMPFVVGGVALAVSGPLAPARDGWSPVAARDRRRSRSRTPSRPRRSSSPSRPS